MAMTVSLSDEEAAALQVHADSQSRSVQEVLSSPMRGYVERHARQARIGAVLDSELPRYAEALERLGQ